MSTLEYDPLRFITGTQEITESNGNCFEHQLKERIRDMLLKCKRLGDGCKIMVQVPFDDATRSFNWETKNPTMKDANL